MGVACVTRARQSLSWNNLEGISQLQVKGIGTMIILKLVLLQ